ncbi:type III-B CRISPR module RAMP protein Cmr4 [Nocardiopsis quinghaiensis]|uniref:type III-B CRISPR module RAMP protein Cmr4 n=1 Tax=Nocardiopsis quinghaiensis TaxID=464995 RepID=UPI00123A50C6|nr:type III-B CRISPR module RAMP protein Cmr4 [Nocardiopsis quinghaiensis]
MTSFLLYLYTESPLHAGAADAEGSLNLPIQRESTTGYPVVWGQSLKGALRAAGYDAGWGQGSLDRVFGKAVQRDGEPGVNPTAGLLTVGDAQLVALPVPTLRRTFAWATSSVALSRLSRKYTRTGLPGEIPDVPDIAHDRGVALDTEWTASDQVVGPCLVPMSRPTTAGGLENWAERIATDGIGDGSALAYFADKFRTDMLLVGTSIMDQLLRECTEYAVRVQLNPDTKTVEHGPFTSEYLPTETLLATVLTLRTPQGKDTEHDAEHQRLLRKLFDGSVLQIGGDETLGKGLVWSRLAGEGTGE